MPVADSVGVDGPSLVGDVGPEAEGVTKEDDVVTDEGDVGEVGNEGAVLVGEARGVPSPGEEPVGLARVPAVDEVGVVPPPHPPHPGNHRWKRPAWASADSTGDSVGDVTCETV